MFENAQAKRYLVQATWLQPQAVRDGLEDAFLPFWTGGSSEMTEPGLSFVVPR